MNNLVITILLSVTIMHSVKHKIKLLHQNFPFHSYQIVLVFIEINKIGSDSTAIITDIYIFQIKNLYWLAH